MKGGGKYIRVWVYGANAKYLETVENQSRTVNEALAAHSQLQAGNLNSPSLDNAVLTDSGTVYSDSVSNGPTVVRAMSLSTSSISAAPKLTCENGHLLNAITGQCVGKMCEFAK